MLRKFFRKQKGYALINILGLSLGMAVALLIGLWIRDELSFDTYHAKHRSLAQVMLTQTYNGQTGTFAAVSIPMGMELRTKWASSFAHVALTSWNYAHTLAVGDKKISQAGMFAQAELPGMLTLHMLRGRQDAMKDPSALLLDQSTAKALFGDQDPMGKTIRVDDKTDVTVAGVYEDLPLNTTLHDIHYLLTWEKYLTFYDFLQTAQQEWGNQSFQIFVEMNPHVDMGSTTRAIRYLTRSHNKEGNQELVLQPMDNWHLYSTFENGKVVGGRIQFVWLNPWN